MTLFIERLLMAAADQEEGFDVVQGLTRTDKTLSPRYFYDDAGSTLFEAICELPEYYPTRTEAAILAACAPQVAALTGECELVELGSGSATKTRILLNAHRQAQHRLRYLPIDISAGILEESAEALLVDYPGLDVYGLVGTFEAGLAHLPAQILKSRMLLFLGSTLGNLDPLACQQFFDQVADSLAPGGYFLLGVDLHKPTAILEAAYDDSQGITAAFNRNMLLHLNRRYKGNFDPAAFDHLALYNTEKQQIEMHLVSRIAQWVTLEKLALSVEFAPGERLHTEISRKFGVSTLKANLEAHGLPCVQLWTDPQSWFCVMLCRRA
ncbi:MAG: L-histidine N(alpha)-methyltransferase [Anaerolineae bacterium]|nr:L-histidine N(alpha)-methyltransferase [Gloeobacterales cyanobacterium ES-bin-313]